MSVGKSAAREELEILRELVDGAPIPMAIGRISDERMMHINPCFTRIFGYSLKEVPTLAEWHRLAYSDPDRRNDAIKEWQAVGEAPMDSQSDRYAYMAVVTCKDGGIRHVETITSVLGNHAIAMFTDLTDRLKAEEALRGSEYYNRTLFETSPLGLVLSQMDGKLLDVNSAFLKILGFTAEEAVTKTFRDFVPAEKVEQHKRALNDLATTGHYGPAEVDCFHADGHRVPVRLRGNSIEMFGQQYLLTSVEDISEQRKTNEQLKQSQMLQSLGTLAGGISHEINNLLMPIIGLAELVRDDLTDEENIRNLDDILSAAEHASQLVGKILAFSYQTPVDRQLVSLEAAIDKTVEFLRLTVPSNVEVTRNIEPLAKVEVDEGQLQQIIMNLWSNAVHAMGLKGGRLEIAAAICSPDRSFFERHPQLGQGDYVRLAVQDTGSGISQETISRVFEPFFTTKPVGEGTGMGLSVVHGIVESHGGVIQIESETGKGTVVEVYLPAA